MIYSTKLKRTLLNISCGNGHRSWDFKIDKNVISFVYIRDQQIFSATKDLSSTALLPLIVNYSHFYISTSLPNNNNFYKKLCYLPSRAVTIQKKFTASSPFRFLMKTTFYFCLEVKIAP